MNEERPLADLPFHRIALGRPGGWELLPPTELEADSIGEICTMGRRFQGTPGLLRARKVLLRLVGEKEFLRCSLNRSVLLGNWGLLNGLDRAWVADVTSMLRPQNEIELQWTLGEAPQGLSPKLPPYDIHLEIYE